MEARDKPPALRIPCCTEIFTNRNKTGMEQRDKITRNFVSPLIIFLFAFFLRRYFFCGFILGDDAEEFHLLQHLTVHVPDFKGHLQYRFGIWLFNVLCFKLFGISETTFFLPTWLLSSSLSVIGYFVLLSWRYKPIHAFLTSLFVASAPYEVLIGTVRANDLILSWSLAVGFLFFVLFGKRPILQGLLLAFFLWFAFYVKLWAIYLIPPLGFYYIAQVIRYKQWHGLESFALMSVFLHGISSIFWKMTTGYFLPFFAKYSATYPVATKDLVFTFSHYPKMIFQGSEFGTTLFGFTPYLLLVLLIIKSTMSLLPNAFSNNFKIDKHDLCLIAYYGTFFLFLNFFPNTFTFDQYYSAPRIFRYLAPLSFPMSLHLAKLILDLCKECFPVVLNKKHIVICIIFSLIVGNIYQTNSATTPGQTYRNALFSIIKDIKEQSPPVLVADSWLGFFLREVYLKTEGKKIDIVPIHGIYSVKDYEKWLDTHQSSLPDGAMLITGLCNFVHYGGFYDGFRLRQFSKDLDYTWKLFKEYQMLNYLPLPEPACLWRLSGN